MGRVKESIPDYVWDFTPEKMDKFWLTENIKSLVSMAKPDDNDELRVFLENVTPVTGPEYFIFVQDEKGTYVNIKYNRKDYIDALCLLSKEKITLFYHIASFEDWINNENATAVRCLYVDIDDVGINANEADRDTVIEFLHNELKLSEEHFPDYIILSGHGIHACWLISELSSEDEELRMKYTGSLITRLGGDFSGAPISHQFKCPCSYNLKDEIIKGKLFKLTDCNNTDIHRLDWCLLSDDEVDEYRSNYYTRVHEKGIQTMLNNKRLEKEFLEKLGDITLEEYLTILDISDKNRAIANKLIKIEERKLTAKKLAEYLSEQKKQYCS